PKYQRRRNAQIDPSYGLAGLTRTCELSSGFAGCAPEYGQCQSGDEACQRHYPDVGGDRRQDVGGGEYHEDQGKQLLALNVSQLGGENGPEQHDGKGE
nr:hypothetical protein [Tanacetum cinerariifolium]